MPRLEKAEQASACQIICEQARGELDKIKQVVTSLANVELVAANLAKLKPAANDPKVNCLVVSLCARIYTTTTLVCAFQ